MADILTKVLLIGGPFDGEERSLSEVIPHLDIPIPMPLSLLTASEEARERFGMIVARYSRQLIVDRTFYALYRFVKLVRI